MIRSDLAGRIFLLFAIWRSRPSFLRTLAERNFEYHLGSSYDFGSIPGRPGVAAKMLAVSDDGADKATTSGKRVMLQRNGHIMKSN